MARRARAMRGPPPFWARISFAILPAGMADGSRRRSTSTCGAAAGWCRRCSTANGAQVPSACGCSASIRSPRRRRPRPSTWRARGLCCPSSRHPDSSTSIRRRRHGCRPRRPRRSCSPRRSRPALPSPTSAWRSNCSAPRARSRACCWRPSSPCHARRWKSLHPGWWSASRPRLRISRASPTASISTSRPLRCLPSRLGSSSCMLPSALPSNSAARCSARCARSASLPARSCCCWPASCWPSRSSPGWRASSSGLASRHSCFRTFRQPCADSMAPRCPAR